MFTLAFILVALALFVLDIVFVELEMFGWATVVLVATVAAAQYFHLIDAWSFVKDHVLLSLAYAGGYVVVGVVWSFLKWGSFLWNFRNTFRNIKAEFRDEVGSEAANWDSIPENRIKEFKSFLSQNYSAYSHQDDYTPFYNAISNLKKPRATENKKRICFWMALWPCSLVGTFLNDPVRRLFNWLFNQFKGLYQKMADHMFAKDSELK